MTLVDTSVWVDHLRHASDRLSSLLQEEQVLCHPFIIGELACGNLANRVQLLSLLAALPASPVVEHGEALHFIESHELHGQGLGWIDIHLLASALLGRCQLWTHDAPLRKAASRLGIAG